MKFTVLLSKFICIIILSTCLISSCKKNDNGGGTGNPPPGNPGSSANADSLSDHLQFFGATKKQGNIPQGPATSSLKISFKDTLYLMDQVPRPIKFLHTDITKNVAGVYMQVFIGGTGGPLGATYYYDVPELPDISASDTVSVVMIGFDPAGIKLPLTFDVKIIPYDKNKQPIAQADRHAKITEHKVDPKSNASSCGLVLPSGEYWRWQCSYIVKNNGGLSFYNDPNKFFGAEGQFIKGSCCNGTSIYGTCPGSPLPPNRSLHFATYYRIASEILAFNVNGTFIRETIEESPIPLPASSDFCSVAEGIIKANTNFTTYNGNYTITPATLPPDLQAYHDSLRLSLLQTSSTGFGYGNPGGIIHQLDCNIGALVLIQLDPEGFGQHLYKFYERRLPGDILWWTFN
jgi:hypothetical protein